MTLPADGRPWGFPSVITRCLLRFQSEAVYSEGVRNGWLVNPHFQSGWCALNHQTIQKTDLSLLERMGDSRYRTAAWGKFLKRYSRQFYVWFKRWGIDPHSMDDVLQETLIRVLGDLKTFDRRHHGSFRAWLKSLARHSWTQLLEDTQRQLARREPDKVRSLNWTRISSQVAGDDLESLFDAWATQELLELAQSQVRQRTSEDVWQTYVRVCQCAEPVPQVAAGMNLQKVQVYDRVSHVRKMIREALIQLEGTNA